MSKLAAGGKLVLALALIFTILVSVAWAFKPGQGLRDFGSFVGAGKASARGEDPYAVYPDTYRVAYRGSSIDAPNLNPPISVYLFRALAPLEPGDTKLGLQIVSLAAYAAILGLLLRGRRERDALLVIWTLALAGFWHTLALGQVYVLLLALLAGGWVLQPRRPVPAGLLIGILIAMKPAFAVWPVLLFLRGERRTSVSSALTAAGISLVPLTLEGPGIYSGWLEASSAFAGIDLPGNSSVVAVAARLGLEQAGLALAGLLLTGLGIWVWRRRPPLAHVSALAIVAALLAGPITWAGYTLFALPAFLSRRWRRWEWTAALPLAVPLAAVFDLAATGEAAHLIAGSLYAFSLLILLGLVWRDAAQAQDLLVSEPEQRAEPAVGPGEFAAAA